ncbi:MAG: hypothetical protein H0U40_04890 [Chloroflexia bacterium]|nr:hypothetical protein [Chloroflexia bacterium]
MTAASVRVSIRRYSVNQPASIAGHMVVPVAGYDVPGSRDRVGHSVHAAAGPGITGRPAG